MAKIQNRGRRAIQQPRNRPNPRQQVSNTRRKTEHRYSSRYRNHDSKHSVAAVYTKQLIKTSPGNRFSKGAWKAAQKLRPGPQESFCICQQNDNCGSRCHNRLMRYECDDDNCMLGKRCSNRIFSTLGNIDQDGRFCDVRETDKKGRGLFTTEILAQGTFVAEYTGDIFTMDECKAAIASSSRVTNNNYLMSLTNHLVCDATNGGRARYINHSCAPNTEVQQWLVAGFPRLGIFALQDISEWDELTLNYNFQPFPGNDPQPCFCGAQSCRGFIGSVGKIGTISNPILIE